MNTTNTKPDLATAIPCEAGPAIIPVAVPLFQGGVFLDFDTGTTVEALMVDRLGLDHEYAFGRVQTIFLNGHPVDDLGAKVNDGAVIALSAALPGLIGATMRKMGVLSSFRSGISHRNDETVATGGDGVFTLKLFNVVLPETAPDLLSRGVYLTTQRLSDRIAIQPTSFFVSEPSILLDGKAVTLVQDMAGLPGVEPDSLLHLVVKP